MSDEVQALFPFNFMKTNNNKIQGKTKPKNKGFFAKFKNFFRFKKSGKQMDAKPISSIPTFHADEPQRLPSEKADPYWVKARRKQYFDMGLGHDSKYPEHKNPFQIKSLFSVHNHLLICEIPKDWKTISIFDSLKKWFVQARKPAKGVSRSDSFIFKSYTVPPKPPRASMSSKPDTPTKVSPSELEKRKKYFDYGMGHVLYNSKNHNKNPYI
ncbi:hypothetical protein BLOT_016597 [Blomia tropicalis]|nr:hypothetical protein BLOT_016597 [Blomia tropicalis]